MNTKNETQIQRVIQAYGDLLYRTAYVLLANPHDIQDVLQEVFLKYMDKAPAFRDEEHEKAWMIRTTVNLCKDFLRFNRRHAYVSLEQLDTACEIPEDHEIMKEVLLLPPKYKTVLLLHYIEGYRLKEISQILGISESAAKKRLQRGKEALKQKLTE